MTTQQAAAEARRLSKDGSCLVFEMVGHNPQVNNGDAYFNFTVVIDGAVYRGESFDECFDQIAKKEVAE